MIALGTTEIKAAKLGNTNASAVYIGDNKVWPNSLISYITID